MSGKHGRVSLGDAARRRIERGTQIQRDGQMDGLTELEGKIDRGRPGRPCSIREGTEWEGENALRVKKNTSSLRCEKKLQPSSPYVCIDLSNA